ncbi:MAG TPA: cytochrome c peroxidase [Anaeromyxobacteraceae bacterium]|nr:cytochrome c peroxidase [Anaeromyxobacteraceae bacterium]
MRRRSDARSDATASTRSGRRARVAAGAPAIAAAALALLAAVAAGCRSASVRPPSPPPPWELANPIVPLPAPPLGIDVDLAALGATPEKVRLGRWLFYDARLSVDGTVSCATCHRPEHAFSEPLPVSTGVGGRTGTRKAPTVVNSGFPVSPVWFWDGRASSLAEQAKGPMENPVEMANTHPRVVATISGVRSYARYFREAYGDERIDIDRIADAIAAYEATRLSGGSAFDRFDAGDETALSALAQEGRDLFFGAARCNACHLGPNFSDSKFHNLGVGFEWRPLRAALDSFADPGRFAVTKVEKDLGAFKTPTLRDVTRRAPYMHDGSVATLEEAVFFYVRGGNQNPWLAPEMDEVRLAPWQVGAVVAFLEALDGTGYQDVPPAAFPE